MQQSKTLDEALDRFEETHQRKMRPSRARWMDADERRDEWERAQELDYLAERARAEWEKNSDASDS